MTEKQPFFIQNNRVQWQWLDDLDAVTVTIENQRRAIQKKTKTIQTTTFEMQKTCYVFFSAVTRNKISNQNCEGRRD